MTAKPRSCLIYYRPQFEEALARFVPRPGALYEVMVKPDPKEEKMFYTYAIHEVERPEQLALFEKRCLLEAKYFVRKSEENARTASRLGSAATEEEVMNEYLETHSSHLITKTEDGRIKYGVARGPSASAAYASKKKRYHR